MLRLKRNKEGEEKERALKGRLNPREEKVDGSWAWGDIFGRGVTASFVLMYSPLLTTGAYVVGNILLGKDIKKRVREHPLFPWMVEVRKYTGKPVFSVSALDLVNEIFEEGVWKGVMKVALIAGDTLVGMLGNSMMNVTQAGITSARGYKLDYPLYSRFLLNLGHGAMIYHYGWKGVGIALSVGLLHRLIGVYAMEKEVEREAKKLNTDVFTYLENMGRAQEAKGLLIRAKDAIEDPSPENIEDLRNYVSYLRKQGVVFPGALRGWEAN
ncbi:MAG: hypothetical protein GXN92_02650 [Candidatus Micrarchaeota archaeon]|nr:hypothetical protein [Candidatus Micrarchaeota archaeon]